MKKGEKRLQLLNRIKEYRLYGAGGGVPMTRTALADAIGVTRFTIRAFELQQAVPTQGHAEALAKFFGCKIGQLFYFPE